EQGARRSRRLSALRRRPAPAPLHRLAHQETLTRFSGATTPARGRALFLPMHKLPVLLLFALAAVVASAESGASRHPPASSPAAADPQRADRDHETLWAGWREQHPDAERLKENPRERFLWQDG